MPVNVKSTLTAQEKIWKKEFGELQSITPLQQAYVQKFKFEKNTT